ncbi:MAG: exodeoxyribonuclease V subunit gamma, partial [Anaerolineae bacterium]
QVYTAYQARLQAQGWDDRAGLGWLAVEALEERATDAPHKWPLLVADGFDNLTPVQLALLKVLAGRVGEVIVTLTGVADRGPRPLAHRRFDRTRRALEEALGVLARPLPERTWHQVPALAHLEDSLFSSDATRMESAGAVESIEAPDRAGEVRAALRWLKARLVEDGMRPGEVALLARSLGPYRPFILETAAEFGLPVRLADGRPLPANPAVTALLDLLRLMLPRAEGLSEPALPRRLAIEAWRSPYFDWTALPEAGAREPIGITSGDADALAAAARWGRVIGGLGQWAEALDSLSHRAEGVGMDAGQDEERGRPTAVPVGSAAQALRARFGRFVRRLTPPQGARSYREFVGWLEALIGPDPALASARDPAPEEPTALQIVVQARATAEAIAERDVAALQALKDVLRGLVWAEEALGVGQAVEFSRLFDELVGAVEATTYHRPMRPEREEIAVADVVQARGVPFRAVAVLGLADGEFPAALSEDPFLRDADRMVLGQDYAFPLELSTESSEFEFFYETVTRARERLLLTRPRLADNGAPWQASPFWEEVRRRVEVQPVTLTGEGVPAPDRAASWPELTIGLATYPGYDGVRAWAGRERPARQAALDAAASLFCLRSSGATDSPFEGDLSQQADLFEQRFGPGHTWSASRLEAYRACPFFFFVGNVLGLEPRPEPMEGLDVRQLGNVYHRIFERLYSAVADPSDLEGLLAALPGVAQATLDEAPQQEGFRQTAWWEQTRAEIVAHVHRSLEALAEIEGDYTPCCYEAAFGLEGQPPLIVRAGDDCFRLRGLIDRIDRASGGRLRVIDYKTGGPAAFGRRAVVQGKKLQLPLYALAARDVLGLGDPVEGFYWHVRHAAASGFTLSGFDGGPEGAIEVAVEHAWQAIRSARGGHFVPHPLDDGCPPYCPATAFCWRYRPRFGCGG